MNFAVIDLLDRDGQVRQTVPVRAWPLRIGRSLDNGLVLTDPHVAAHHFTIELGEAGLQLAIGDTANGVGLGRQRLRRGECRPLPDSRLGAVELSVGRTRLRLHRPDEALTPELPLATTESTTRQVTLPVVALVALLAAVALNTWLGSDPDSFGRALGATLVTVSSGAVAWCGAWALLSKTFTRQARFGWHLRVFLFGSIGLLLVGALPPVLAFAFSWPALTDFSFVGSFLIGGVAVYFHLLAVEPARERLLRWVVGAGALAGIGATLWLNLARTDLYGDELYMSHLLPPAMRLAPAIPADRFVDGLVRLKPLLDRKARETGNNGSDPGPPGAESDD